MNYGSNEAEFDLGGISVIKGSLSSANAVDEKNMCLAN